MWITKYMSKNSEAVVGNSLGSVMANLGTGVEVNASMSHRNLPLVTSFGYEYIPPVGESAVVANVEGSQVCLGTVTSIPKGLSPGEVRIMSKGGASITLKKDGSIQIEGKVYINGEEVAF